MEYVLIFLGFVTVTLGVFGDTWDKNEKRLLHRVKRLGWITLTVAIVIAGLQVASTWEEKDATSKLQRAAEKNIRNGLADMLSPYWRIYLRFTRQTAPFGVGKKVDGSKAVEDMVETASKEALRSRSFVEYLSKCDVRQESSDASRMRRMILVEEIAEDLDDGRKKIRETLDSYGACLDKTKTTAWEDVISDEYLQASINRAKVVLVLTKRDPGYVDYVLPADSSDSAKRVVDQYKTFVSRLFVALDQISEK